MTALFGGAFDPPHNGHVELVRTAEERFDTGEVVVLVSARPGHKGVAAGVEARLQLARAAFSGHEVELDPYERTVDLLKAGRWNEPLFLIGADEFCDFLTWKDPNGVLARARLGVATRPGYPRDRLDTVLRELARPDRVEFFEIEARPIASRDIRERVGRGEPIDDLVPAAVAELIEGLNLYRD